MASQATETVRGKVLKEPALTDLGIPRSVIVTLRGEPRGKGRPRSRIATGKAGQQFVAVYTDAKTRAYERAVALAGRVAMGSRPPLDGPLAATITAVMGVPSSWPRKRRDAALAGTVHPTGVPDWDNIAKAALDALNGIVYQDDSQIVRSTVEKVYGEDPRLVVSVEPLEVGLFSPPESTEVALAGETL